MFWNHRSFILPELSITRWLYNTHCRASVVHVVYILMGMCAEVHHCRHARIRAAGLLAETTSTRLLLKLCHVCIGLGRSLLVQRRKVRGEIVQFVVKHLLLHNKST